MIKTQLKPVRPFFSNPEDRWLNDIEKILNDKKLSEIQRKELREYNKFLASRSLKPRSRISSLKYVKYFGYFIKKPFEKVIKKDIINYMAKVEKDTPKSFNMYQSGIHKFYKEFLNKKNLFDDVKWKRDGKHKLPEELLSVEEIKKIIEKCTNIRDKALIMVLYDSYCRVGELINAKIKNLYPDEYGFKIGLNGKTGMRRNRLINSVPYLKEWINHHPYADDPEAPLFINESTNHYGEALRSQGINKILKLASKRANIKKNVHAHLLRHSSLTQGAKLYTESELKIIAGWSGDSNMPKVYIHLSGEDVDKKVLMNAGKLKKEEMDKESKKLKLLRPKICIDPSCKCENPATAKFCIKCHRPLDFKAIEEVEKGKQNYEEVLKDFISNNNEFKEALVKAFIEKGVKFN